MKKIISLGMMFILSVVMAFCAVGCNGCGNALTLDKTQLDMFVGESTALTVKQQSDLSWTTSDDTVAVVSNSGVVTAVGAGSATITVSNGNKSAECAVNVTDVIDFSLADDEFSICRGYRVLIRTTTLKNNVLVDEGSFTFASDNTGVATVDKDGYVSAIKNGEANVTVTWTLNGQSYSAVIKIIVENKVDIYMGEQTSAIRVYGDTERTFKFDPRVKANYAWVDTPVLTFKSTDENIATVDANGVVTGVGLGEVEIVATYTFEGMAYSNSITVTTSRAIENSDKTYTVGYETADLVIPATDFVGKVEEVRVIGEVIDFSLNADGDIVISSSNFDKVMAVKVAICTDKVEKTVNLNIITGIIMTAEDLDMMDVWGRTNDANDMTLGIEHNLFAYSGTFILGADIDYGGKEYRSEMWIGTGGNYGYVSGAGAYWNGLKFDGQGHVISNIEFDSTSSLFGSRVSNSVICNLALTDVKLSGTYAATIARSLTGSTKLENIFVDGYSVAENALTDYSFVVGSKDESATIKNVLVNVTSTEATTKMAGIVNLTANDTSLLDGITNAYVIGSAKGVTYSHEKDAENPWGYWAPVDGAVGTYLTAEEFIADKDEIFTGDFNKVFRLVRGEVGGTALRFFSTDVLQFADGIASYTFAYQNQDFIIDKESIGADLYKVTLDGKELPFTVNADGDYVVDKSQFTSAGNYIIKIRTVEKSFKRIVRVNTAVIKSVEDFQNIATWGKKNVSYVLESDLDFKGENSKITGTLEKFNFDGQGHTITNVALTRGIFGNDFVSGTIKDLAITGVTINGNFQAVVVEGLSGGNILNLFVQGRQTAGTLNSMLVRNYNSGTIKNVIVDFDPMSKTNNTSMIACITDFNAVVSGSAGSYVRDQAAKVNQAMPDGIANVYSIGLKSKHVVADNYTALPANKWNNYVTVNTAKGGYADDGAFLADIENIVSGDFANAFSIEKNELGNAVLYFYGVPVKEFADGPISYSFGFRTNDLVLPKSDFDGKVQSIKIGVNQVEFTTNANGDYVIDRSNFISTGYAVLTVTTDEEVYKHNVEIYTALITTAEQLDMMDEWGRPADFNATNLGKTGYLYTYSGKFLLGADIDYGGKEYLSEMWVGTGGNYGYVSGAGAYWKGMTFDGQGHVISNIEFDSTSSLFGSWITDSKISNLALKNVKLSGTYSCGIGVNLKGTTSLKNIFVDGYSVSENSLTDYSFVVTGKEDTATIENVLVNISSCAADTKMAGVIKTSNNASILETVKNVYTIGSLKNIVYSHAATTEYKWGYWTPVDGTAGGYANEKAFIADKDKIFTGDFANVFSIETNEKGNTLVYFMGTLVKVYVGDVIDYTVGRFSGDIVIGKNEVSSEITSIILESKPVTFTKDTDGNYVIKGADLNVTNNGLYCLEVIAGDTVDYKNIKLITAIINTADDFVAMHTYDDPSSGTTGTFILTNDIDLTGKTWTPKTWNTLNFDGQGHTIANASGANLFAGQIFGGTIENVAVINYARTGNWSGGLVATLSGGAIKNVYVQGGNAAALARAGMLVHEYANTSAVLENIVVDYNGAGGNQFSIIATVGAAETNADYAVPANIKNVYSIGNINKHITYGKTGGTSDVYYTLTGAQDSAFTLEKELFDSNAFTGDFAKTFTVGEDANGTRVLKFFGKTVKHTVGYMNTDLIIDASELGVKDGDTVTVNYAGADLTGISVASGKITVPKTNFTAVGKGLITITAGENSYYRQLNVATALINSVDTFKAISTYGMASGTYLQTKDIDFNNTTYSNTGNGTYNYDGQGYAIKNVTTSGLFCNLMRGGSIKNVAVIDATWAGNYAAVICQEIMFNNTAIENVYVRVNNPTTNRPMSSGLVRKIYGNYNVVIKNVFVDWNNSIVGWQTTAIGYIVESNGTTSQNSSRIPSTIASVYSIGRSGSHISRFTGNAYGSGNATSITTAGAAGGYADATAFFGAKATVFTGAFNNAFRLVETDTATTMNFYGREVLTLSK